jgi:HSP20 family protein
MTIVRWSPVRDLAAWYPVSNLANEVINMQREIDCMFDRFRGGVADNADTETQTWLPSVDILERESEFLVRAELPGVKKEDVKITVTNDILTIRGDKKTETQNKGDKIQRLERTFGAFQRSFTLPSAVAHDKIEASFDNGVLHITIPKVKEAAAKEIEVRVK